MNDLAKEAQKGNPDALAALWGQVKRLAFSIANQYGAAAAANRAADADDLTQCAALGMMEALQSYDPDHGSFSGWLGYYVRKACRECLGLTGRNRDEVYKAVSLDAPIDAEDLTLADTLPDEGATLAFDDVEDELTREALRRDLVEALSRLPKDMRRTIQLHDLDGLTMEETAAAQGFGRTHATQLRATGLRRLRHVRKLADYYVPSYHRHKGLAAFKTTWSSVVEDLVIEKMERRPPQ